MATGASLAPAHARRPARSTALAATGLLLVPVLLLATDAGAVGPEPPVVAVLPGLGAAPELAPGDPLYLFRQSPAPQDAPPVDLLRPTTLTDHRIWGGFRDRRIKVIHYAAPLRVNQTEMTLNLDAPGAGRAILSLELEF